LVLKPVTRLVTFALALGLLTPSLSTADEVTDWNQIMVSALTATNTSPQNAGRIAAITSAAVFDAVNGIAPRYTPYFITKPGPRGASRRAAAVQAALALKALAASRGTRAAARPSIAAIRSDEHGQAVDSESRGQL
jgi:hypothetical protein